MEIHGKKAPAIYPFGVRNTSIAIFAISTPLQKSLLPMIVPVVNLHTAYEVHIVDTILSIQKQIPTRQN
jgi:hypothetical protein